MTPHRIALLTGLALYLTLAFYQLGLPGLHYDEAREAGLNAMEILTGAPITAFRSVGVEVGGRIFPLMVQDYIGALNVYLALPFLATTGIGVPNLRALPVLCGALTLLLVERSVSEWVTWRSERWRTAVGDRLPPAPISFAGLVAIWLIAASPGFVFWSRQGVFVTNVTQVFVFLCIWQTIRWLRTGRSGALVAAALTAGLALYAKLLTIWVIAPLTLFALLTLLRLQKEGAKSISITPSTLVLTALAFAAPLTPLIWFNLQSGGTLTSIVANLGRSYYGIDNLALGANLLTRFGQLVQILRGDQFWYLGAVFANPVAPWVGLALVGLGLLRSPACLTVPLLLLASAVALSVFTVSDLFVTHYALLQPLALSIIATAAGTLLVQKHIDAHPTPSLRFFQAMVTGLLLATFTFDLANTVAYHRALTQSGGLADHSDAGYHLAYHLRYNGMGAPVALDWGIDATVRFLSEGAVTPIEIFGYTSPAAPDDEFEQRLSAFLENPDNVYLLHSEQATVFKGRRERFFAAAAAQGRTPVLERRFTQRDGAALYEIWKVP
ncbi:MAG: hypothetical protein NZ553_14405 [Caldilinea sp.]|nr:hypothetical protein [Caldilinea sp.]MDW8441664.1 hypothetical protein [Caldilineaceae bacterium]